MIVAIMITGLSILCIAFYAEIINRGSIISNQADEIHLLLSKKKQLEEFEWYQKYKHDYLLESNRKQELIIQQYAKIISESIEIIEGLNLLEEISHRVTDNSKLTVIDKWKKEIQNAHKKN